MLPWNAARKIISLCIAVALLSACVEKMPARTGEPSLHGTATLAPTTPASPAVSPTSTSTVSAASSPAAKNTATPASPGAQAPTSPSGWTVYTNPDYVRGLAVEGLTLWAATLGGVVAWDLTSDTPTLFGTRDGLAEIQSNDIAYCPDPEDRIYVAHSSATLSVYDLVLKKWSRLLITFEDGSTMKGVQTLYCDVANHRLLVGSSEGIGILDMETGRWRKIGPEQGLKLDQIHSIDVSGQAIWVAAGDKGAYLIQGSTVFPFDTASGFPSGQVNDLSVAADASVWLGYTSSLVHYQNKKWSPYGVKSPSVIPFQTVDFVKIGPDKSVWVASADEGVCPFDQTAFFCDTIYPGISGTPITDLAVGANGIAYAATDGSGVLVLHPHYVSKLAFNQGHLLSDNVQDIAEDSSGRLWISSDRGINLVDPAHPETPWQYHTPQNGGLAYPQVSGMLPAANGMWLFYAQASQAFFMSDDTRLNLDASKGLTEPVVSAALYQRGAVWFATAHNILSWDGSVMHSYTPSENLNTGKINTLFYADDSMWLGADHGLFRYQRSQWKTVLPDITVDAIYKDKDGSLLLGTGQGLIRYDGNQSFLWVINLGDKVVSFPKVTAVTRDGKGRLWVGTAGQGVFNYNGTHWEEFNTTNGLPTDYVRKIYTDHLGAIWIAVVTDAGAGEGGAVVHFVP